MNKYYVYSHLDPVTKEVVYVGSGQFDRAWNVRRNQRREEHVSWLESIYDSGYTLSDVVVIEDNNLSKEDSYIIESELIKTLKPKFNALLNPEHWHIGRRQPREVAEFAKTLHEMGYGYIRIAQLLGGTNNNHMSIKRMIGYV